MKKLCLILALIMALGALVGCSSGPDKDGYYHAGATFEYDGFKVKVGKYEVGSDGLISIPFEVTNERAESYNNYSFETWRCVFDKDPDWRKAEGEKIFYHWNFKEIPGGDTKKMVASILYRGVGEYKIYCTRTGVIDGTDNRDPDEKIIVFKISKSDATKAGLTL